MAAPEVRAVAGPRDWILGNEPRVVPAGPLVFAVSGSRSRTVLLDGRQTRLSAGTAGLVAVDLTRSTGYHRLQVDGNVFWFGTEDAKLGLEGVEAMLAHLRTVGTGWTGQALFSDGSGLRDAHVLYAWLDQWVEDALGPAGANAVTGRGSPVAVSAEDRWTAPTRRPGSCSRCPPPGALTPGTEARPESPVAEGGGDPFLS